MTNVSGPGSDPHKPSVVAKSDKGGSLLWDFGDVAQPTARAAGLACGPACGPALGLAPAGANARRGLSDWAGVWPGVGRRRHWRRRRLWRLFLLGGTEIDSRAPMAVVQTLQRAYP